MINITHNKKIHRKTIEYIFVLTLCILNIIYFMEYGNYNILRPSQIPKHLIIPIASLLCFIFLDLTLPKSKEIICDKPPITVFFVNSIVVGFISIIISGKQLSNKYGLAIHLLLLIILAVTYFNKRNPIRANFNVKAKYIIIIFIAFFIYKGFQALALRGYAFTPHSNISRYLAIVAWNILYPALYEETLYRLYLISIFKYYKLSDLTANILQCLIFGIVHYSIYPFKELGLVYTLMACSGQAFLGFIFGKIYIRTKSLTYPIILHVLFDVI